MAKLYFQCTYEVNLKLRLLLRTVNNAYYNALCTYTTISNITLIRGSIKRFYALCTYTTIGNITLIRGSIKRFYDVVYKGQLFHCYCWYGYNDLLMYVRYTLQPGLMRVQLDQTNSVIHSTAHYVNTKGHIILVSLEVYSGMVVSPLQCYNFKCILSRILGQF